MMAALPEDIDKSEHNIPWDYTRPAALEKAEFVEFRLNEAIKTIFPHWAYNEWLDYHAEAQGLSRRPANRASGTVMVSGVPGTTVAEGFQFATQANLTPSVIFEATEETTLGTGEYVITDMGTPPEPVIRITLNVPTQRPLLLTLQPGSGLDTGELLLQNGETTLEAYTFDIGGGADQVTGLMDALATTPSAYFTAEQLAGSGKPLVSVMQAPIGTEIPIQAVEGGNGGNVPPDTVILMVRPESGISYMTNPQATTGGTPEESEDELRERILSMIRLGMSYTGCDADYVRWAREVPGVGNAIPDAEWAGPGTVRLFVIDGNGLPANQQIIDAVYTHIIHPENRMERLAPIGATLTVAAPVPIYVDVAAKVTLREGENTQTIMERFTENLNAYWLRAVSETELFDVEAGTGANYIKYVFVGSTLAETAGIANYDHTSLTVNGGTDDILIPIGMYPVTRGVNLIV
jgi:uncharacterized phage protein gp47/JayE